MVNDRAVVGTPWEKSLHEFIFIHALLSVIAELSSPLKHLFIWILDRLGALPLVHQEMEAEHSLSDARPLRPTCALKPLQMGWRNNLTV